MKRYVACVVLAGLLAATGSAQQKKRVAVLNFEYAAVQSQVAALFGTNIDVGKGVADLLVDRLVRGGAFSVIERKAIDKIMAEQNFSNSDRADASSAAKIGRLLGVQAIVIGSICALGIVIVSLFAGWTLGTWFSIAMIVLMATVILYQTNEIKNTMETDQHVAAAFVLFSSFVTLLFYVIRLFAGRRE